MKQHKRWKGWEDISDILTEEGLAKITEGQVLIFDKDGEQQHYKVMHKTKTRCWVKQIRLYHPDEVDVIDESKDDAGKA